MNYLFTYKKGVFHFEEHDHFSIGIKNDLLKKTKIFYARKKYLENIQHL